MTTPLDSARTSNGTSWDERYAQTEYFYGTTPNAFLFSVYGRIPSGRVLCLAEGEGRNAVFLASRGYQVTAVDSSAVGLRKAEQLANSHQVSITTVCADLNGYIIDPGQWDGIVSCYCHLPSAVRKPLHNQITSGLRPAGVFILEGYSKEQLSYGTGGPSVPDMLFSLEELKDELEGMDFVHAATLERDVREGRGHTGIASVVQIIGTKPS